MYFLDCCMEELFKGHRNIFSYGPLSMILWIVIIIGVVILLLFLFNPEKAKSIFKKNSYKSDPYEILKERYAKGEITKEEFEKIKKNLDNHYLEENKNKGVEK